jgi:nucleolar protein 4
MLFEQSITVCEKPIVVMIEKPREEILDRKRAKDRRNLHLMYEGHITPDMEAAVGVSDAEMAKRKKLWDNKQVKLSDTNNRISPTRLAVFNLPNEIGTGRIRKIFAVAPKRYARTHKTEEIAQAVEKYPIRITEVRKVETQPDVAFLEFTRHEHALCALRQVNNNPTYFEGRRLIVEFAVENSFATKDRRQKEENKKKMRVKRFAEKIADANQGDLDEDSD